MATYEIWLMDDSGRRMGLLRDLYFISYTRAVNGFATVNFGLSFTEFFKEFNPYFRPDWRLEIWRSAAHGIPLRREDVFMLRKPHVYTRDDGVEVIQFYGRNGVDLLNRRSVIQRPGTSYTLKTDQIDDMMKAVVRQQMLYGSALDEDGVVDNTRAWPQNEFEVQADTSLGPSVTREFADRVVFDLLKELSETSFQLHEDSSSNKRIYFDVLPKDVSGSATAYSSPLGWEFQTFAELRGSDRTGSIEFSMANENIEQPAYSFSRLEEVNSVFVKGNGRGDSQIVTSVEDTPRAQQSRWNRCEKILNATSEASTTALQDAGRKELEKGRPVEELLFTLLNTPGGPSAPRSLYGVDWDLGDLIRVNFAGKQFEAIINTIYVAVNEDGKEEITGRSEVE